MGPGMRPRRFRRNNLRRVRIFIHFGTTSMLPSTHIYYTYLPGPYMYRYRQFSLQCHDIAIVGNCLQFRNNVMHM